MTQTVFSQTEKVSECLELTKISESTYIHTCNHNNGVVYIDTKEAIIVSTPDSDLETQNLINWVKTKAKIVGYVIDRWHPDAMEGLNIVHQNGIKSYANNRTKTIAKKKELPVPNIGFDKKLNLKVGTKKIVCHYLGEAHTTDGIVVWIPNENILFAGNGIRNNNGWIGNIADANLNDWSNTAKSIMDHYGNSKIVIPGHGKHGGPELINYTVQLYDFQEKTGCYNLSNADSLFTDSSDRFNFIFMDQQQTTESSLYLNAVVCIEKTGRRFEIYADSIEYYPSKRSIYVRTGCIKLIESDQSEDFFFNELYAKLRDDAVELSVVIKELQ